ncbi:MAG: zinc ribbon domain-containing protein [Desulfurellales bacterium]|nr:MAG: zinc ribbon domain-containing protein [Desulfurellales bacterium]
MPTYEYACVRCAAVTEADRAMALRDDCPRCVHCGGKTHRQISSGIGAAVFRPYESQSWGIPEHVMERAYQDERGNFKVRDGDGREIQLNRPGEKLNPKTGNVLVGSSGERRRALLERGDVDLNDFGGTRGVREENRRRQSVLNERMARARKRLAKGAEIARKRGRKTGWVDG